MAWKAVNVAGNPACESTDEQALHPQCNARVDRAPAGAVPSSVPPARSSTIPSPEMSTLHPGCTWTVAPAMDNARCLLRFINTTAITRTVTIKQHMNARGPPVTPFYVTLQSMPHSGWISCRQLNPGWKNSQSLALILRLAKLQKFSRVYTAYIMSAKQHKVVDEWFNGTLGTALRRNNSVAMSSCSALLHALQIHCMQVQWVSE